MALAISVKKGETFSVGDHVFTVHDYFSTEWAILDWDHHVNVEKSPIRLSSTDWAEPVPEIAIQLSHKEKLGFCRILIDAPKFEVLRDNYKDGT